MDKEKAPCKDCQDRRLGCHSECKDYKQWKAEHERRREIIKEQCRKDKMRVKHSEGFWKENERSARLKRRRRG